MPELPEPIADPRRREQAREYARRRRQLFVLELGLGTTFLVVLLASRANIRLREALVPLAPGLFGTVAAYTTVLVLGAALLFLPTACYGGYILPHRYGLSVQSLAGWCSDYAKGTALGLLQTLPVTLAVYALLRYAPTLWWLWAALIIILLGIVLAQLAPILVVPLFFRQRPLEDEHLRRRLVALAEACGTRVGGVYVIDMSRRTRATNAALMGLGRTRRIVLGDTLWERFEPVEIEAVLAHELGHHVHRDLWRGIALEGALVFLALWVAGRVLPLLAAPLGLAGIDDPAGLPLLALATGALFTLLLPVTNGYSRRREAAADRFAVRLTGNAAAWKSALCKLADQNLAEVDPPRWVEWLLSSHPSIRHRLEAADKSAGPT